VLEGGGELLLLLLLPGSSGGKRINLIKSLFPGWADKSGEWGDPPREGGSRIEG